MDQYPFEVDQISDNARKVFQSDDAKNLLEFTHQIREDNRLNPSSNNYLALAWALTKIVNSGVYIDDVSDDIQEASKSLESALSLKPSLSDQSRFIQQKMQTETLLKRVTTFESQLQNEIGKIKDTDDAALDAEQAAELAYNAKNPEKAAHYFLLAANKIINVNPNQATWYLNSRAIALLELEKWDEAQPQLQKMIKANDPHNYWAEQGYIGLMRIAAAKSEPKSFKNLWKKAQKRHHQIPGQSPNYYSILGFGIQHDLLDFVAPVYKVLTDNKVYSKSASDLELLSLASEYISAKN